MPNLLVYDVNSLTNYSGLSWLPPFHDLATAQIFTNGNTIDYVGDVPPQTISVTDDDASFNDGDGSQQTLDQDITLEGKLLVAGTVINPEYSYTLRPEGGTAADDITIYAFEFGTNDIVGFVASSPLQAGTTYTFVGSSNNVDVPYGSVAPCFASGTLIRTSKGDIAIEELSVGDIVITQDLGEQDIKWIGHRTLSEEELARAPNLRPIRISAGALGPNQPEQDLIVSPQHRILVRSQIAQRMFDAPEVLVAAKQLLQLDGIEVEEAAQGVTYHHMLLDGHAVVYSNGAATESMYVGPETLKSISSDALREVLTLFPEVLDFTNQPIPARPFATGRLGRKLAQRHMKNQKPLVAQPEPSDHSTPAH